LGIKNETINVLRLLSDKDFAMSDGLIIFSSLDDGQLEGRILLFTYSHIILDNFPSMEHKEFFSLDSQTILVNYHDAKDIVASCFLD